MGQQATQPPGLEAWRRRRPRSRLRWAIPLVLVLLGGTGASASAAREGLRLTLPANRDTIVVVALAAALLGFAAAWLLALGSAHRSEDGRITAEDRALHGTRAVAAALIYFFLSGTGPAARAILGSSLAGVLVSTGLVVALRTLGVPPFRSPEPDRLSDGNWV